MLQRLPKCVFSSKVYTPFRRIDSPCKDIIHSESGQNFYFCPVLKTVLIVGSGPAGLMAAYQLAQKGYRVLLFDQKKSLSRKLLVAGKGGFNLTHSEPLEMFLERLDADIVKNAVKQFTNEDFRSFLEELGVETFVGSSGRVFC